MIPVEGMPESPALCIWFAHRIVGTELDYSSVIPLPKVNLVPSGASGSFPTEPIPLKVGSGSRTEL